MFRVEVVESVTESTKSNRVESHSGCRISNLSETVDPLIYLVKSSLQTISWSGPKRSHLSSIWLAMSIIPENICRRQYSAHVTCLDWLPFVCRSGQILALKADVLRPKPVKVVSSSVTSSIHSVHTFSPGYAVNKPSPVKARTCLREPSMGFSNRLASQQSFTVLCEDTTIVLP
jgi:hypothetical protein